MHPDLNAPRHAQLFELLRHENLSEHTSARLRARGYARAQLDHDDAVTVRSLAIDSWSGLAA